MVAGSECHLRVDDDIIGITRLMFVEGGADDAILADADRLEIVLFPFLVPVLAFHQCFGKLSKPISPSSAASTSLIMEVSTGEVYVNVSS